MLVLWYWLKPQLQWAAGPVRVAWHPTDHNVLALSMGHEVQLLLTRMPSAVEQPGPGLAATLLDTQSLHSGAAKACVAVAFSAFGQHVAAAFTGAAGLQVAS